MLNHNKITQIFSRKSLSAEILNKEDNVLLVKPRELIINDELIDLDEKKLNIIKSALLGVSGALTLHIFQGIDVILKNKVIEPIVIGVKDFMMYANQPILPFINITTGQMMGLSIAVILAGYIYRVKGENDIRQKKGKSLIPDVYKTHPTLMLVVTTIVTIILGIVMI